MFRESGELYSFLKRVLIETGHPRRCPSFFYETDARHYEQLGQLKLVTGLGRKQTHVLIRGEFKGRGDFCFVLCVPPERGRDGKLSEARFNFGGIQPSRFRETPRKASWMRAVIARLKSYSASGCLQNLLEN